MDGYLMGGFVMFMMGVMMITVAYPHYMEIVLFPFEISGDFDNECYMNYSIHLTNRTDDPLYQIGRKYCSITNQVEYPDYTFSCVDMIE